MYEIISGGVTAAQGFSAGATRCGIKASSQKDDTAIIFSEIPCTAAAVYTKNRVKASPIQVTRDHLANQVAQAVIVNSGNANACAPDGMENAQREAAACAKLLNIPENDVIVCSTGVIGQRINIECIEEKPAHHHADPGRLGRGGKRHHDHRHLPQNHRGIVHRRRQDLPSGRYLQGFGYDSPQYGYHAVLSHHRLRS